MEIIRVKNGGRRQWLKPSLDANQSNLCAQSNIRVAQNCQWLVAKKRLTELLHLSRTRKPATEDYINQLWARLFSYLSWQASQTWLYELHAVLYQTWTSWIAAQADWGKAWRESWYNKVLLYQEFFFSFSEGCSDVKLKISPLPADFWILETVFKPGQALLLRVSSV